MWGAKACLGTQVPLYSQGPRWSLFWYKSKPFQEYCKSKSKHHSPQVEFCSNHIKSSKYTLLTFWVLNPFEQFRRMSNLIYLIMAVVQVSFNWILKFLFRFWIESTSTWNFCRCFYQSPQCHPGQQCCPWCLWWGSAWSSRSASCLWSASSAIYVLLEMVITLWPDRDTKTSWGTGVTLQWTGIQYVWQFPDALKHQQQYKSYSGIWTWV